jgi:hypothetical protein
MPVDCYECDSMTEFGEKLEDTLVGAVSTSIFIGIVSGMALNIVYGLINMV